MAYKEHLEKEVVQKVIRQLLDEERYETLLCVMIPIHTALRPSDWVKLKWGDLMTPDGTPKDLYIVDQKTRRYKKRARRVVMNDDLASVLSIISQKKHIDLIQDQYIFKRKRGPKGKQDHISTVAAYQKVQKLFRDYAERNKVSPYSLRKTYAWLLYMAHKDGPEGELGALQLVAGALNHTSIDVTRTYLGLSKQKTDFFTKTVSFL